MNHIILPDNNFLSEVRPVVEAALNECEEIVPSRKPMRVLIQYTEDSFVSEQMGGSSGLTWDDTHMQVEVNPNVETWKEAAGATVAHEYNHVVWHQIHGKDWKSVTLAELIALEGLAQNFEEHFAGSPPVYATHVDRERLKDVWQKIQDHLDENGMEWWRRLSFEDSDEFPFWSGYSLAYRLVNNKISKFDLSWPELMKVKADELINNAVI